MVCINTQITKDKERPKFKQNSFAAYSCRLGRVVACRVADSPHCRVSRPREDSYTRACRSVDQSEGAFLPRRTPADTTRSLTGHSPVNQQECNNVEFVADRKTRCSGNNKVFLKILLYFIHWNSSKGIL